MSKDKRTVVAGTFGHVGRNATTLLAIALLDHAMKNNVVDTSECQFICRELPKLPAEFNVSSVSIVHETASWKNVQKRHAMQAKHKTNRGFRG